MSGARTTKAASHLSCGLWPKRQPAYTINSVCSCKSESDKDNCVELSPTSGMQGATESKKHTPPTGCSPIWASLLLTMCYIHKSSYLYDWHAVYLFFNFRVRELLLVWPLYVASTSHFPFLKVQVRLHPLARRVPSTFLPHPMRQHFPKSSWSLCSAPPTRFPSADRGVVGRRVL